MIVGVTPDTQPRPAASRTAATTDAAMRPALLSELYDVPIALAEVGGRRVALF